LVGYQFAEPIFDIGSAVKPDQKLREEELLAELAEIATAELRTDAELQRQLAESREAEARGEHGISAREYFSERGREHL